MHREEFEARVAEARELEQQRRVFSDDWDDDEADVRTSATPSPAKRLPRDPEERLAGPSALSVEEVVATPLERRYYSRPFWQKLLFIVAGVVMNMLVAFLLFYAVGWYQGETIAGTLIAKVEAGTPAAAAGIQAGDRILEMAGEPMTAWEEVRAEILRHPGEHVTILAERSGNRVELQADIQRQDDGTGFLGVQLAVEYRELGPVSSIGYAARTTGNMVVLIIKSIGMMFTGDAPVTGSQGLAGPVGIIQLSAEAVEGGYYLMLLALISVNLAILNMIPLLPLDGGHALFIIIERLRGKSISLRTFERVSMVGLVLFVLLFILATSHDFGRIFGG
jgi:regulator of sigma E protease